MANNQSSIIDNQLKGFIRTTGSVEFTPNWCSLVPLLGERRAMFVRFFSLESCVLSLWSVLSTFVERALQIHPFFCKTNPKSSG
jgi:hypothetical protein